MQSKHKTKKVNTGREVVRLALQKKKVDDRAGVSQGLLAQKAKQESEGVIQSEKMLRLVLKS